MQRAFLSGDVRCEATLNTQTDDILELMRGANFVGMFVASTREADALNACARAKQRRSDAGGDQDAKS